MFLSKRRSTFDVPRVVFCREARLCEEGGRLAGCSVYIMSQTNENANKIINEHNLHFPLVYTRRIYTLSGINAATGRKM